MNKKYKILMLTVSLLLIPGIVFAEYDESYENMAIILNDVLNAFSWFGYAIALGILVWIGIKYIISGANERAKLKGTAIMYLIGVALIVLCSTIASGVAELASQNGDNSAEGTVDKIISSMGGTVIKNDEEEHDYSWKQIGKNTYKRDLSNGSIIEYRDERGRVLKSETYDLNGMKIHETISYYGKEEIEELANKLKDEIKEEDYEKLEDEYDKKVEEKIVELNKKRVNENWKTMYKEDNNIIIYYPKDANLKYQDPMNNEPNINAGDNKNYAFLGFYVKETDIKTGEIKKYRVSGSDFYLENSEDGNKKYEIWANYKEVPEGVKYKNGNYYDEYGNGIIFVE